MNEPVTFTLSRDDVLIAPPTFGLAALPSLVQAVDAWCRARRAPGRLVVDLAPVRVVDSASLRSLAWAHRRCRRQGLDLEVVPPGPEVVTLDETVIGQQLFALDASGSRW